MLSGSRDKMVMPTREEALSGRDHRIFPVPTTHEVLGTPLEVRGRTAPRSSTSAMGCFWGAEWIDCGSCRGRDDGRRLPGWVHAVPDP